MTYAVETTRPTRRAALAIIGLGGAAALAGCAGAGSSASAPAAAPAPAAGGDALETARGTFSGRSNHVTTGHARVVRTGGQWVIELEDDFFFDGAPDPKVALGRGGYDPNTILSPLRANTGAQAYALTPGLDIADYDQVWIWCQQFNVPLGVAELTLA